MEALLRLGKYFGNILESYISHTKSLLPSAFNASSPKDAHLRFSKTMRDANVSLDFVQSSYTASLNTAKSSGNILLVYLHAPHHDDTALFVSNVLKNTAFRQFLLDNSLLLWGGNVSETEAYKGIHMYI